MKKAITSVLVAVLLLHCTWATAQQTAAVKEQVLQKLAAIRHAQLHATQAADQARSSLNEQVRVPQVEVIASWEQNRWVDELHNTRTYNTRGQVDKIVVRELPANSLAEQQTYTYNNSGLLTQLLVESRAGNAWVNAEKVTFEYEGNELKSFEVFLWDEEEGAWVLELGLRNTFTSANNRITESVMEAYYRQAPTPGWLLAERKVYTYTGSDSRPSSIVTSERVNNQWVEFEKETEITYNGATLDRSSYMFEERDQQTQAWKKFRYDYQYTQDATARTRTVVETISNVNGTTTTPYTRNTTTMLTDGMRYVDNPVVAMKDEVYDVNVWRLATETKANVTRSANGDITQIVYQEYTLLSSAFVNTERYTYSDFITLTVTGTEDPVLAEAVQVFPNPVNDKLRITLDASKVRHANLAVYSLTGQKVYEQQTLGATATVDMAQLPSGIYLVKVTGDNKGMLTRKIVKM